ncbi:MAG: carboxylating nicotinate-nucleotide diphosphorylase [bacterium]|nr:carboxylating nicotinate-nucleotide diphosphorylase [bacterium]
MDAASLENQEFVTHPGKTVDGLIDVPIQIDESISLLIQNALQEDVEQGDVTTLATVPPDKPGSARVVVKQMGILCGSTLFQEVFNIVDPDVEVICYAPEGQTITPGRTIFTIDGPVQSILVGERVALNLLSYLSGISTTTSEFVKAIRHTKTRILDTRKTVPLLRKLEKYAVRVGGGMNHRFGLYDMVLIKDNHIDSCGTITAAVKAARDKWGNRYAIEVETRNLLEVTEAVQTGVDRIMLDNMDIETMAEAVRLIGGRAETEASGGINLSTVSFVAETGVDYISVGSLTHSAKWLDFSLLLDKRRTESKQNHLNGEKESS